VTARGDSGEATAELVASRVLDVPDFPKPGIVFKDLMPLFADGPAFRAVIDAIVDHHGRDSFDVVAGIEARGFVIAAAVAYAAGVGVVPIRKAGKLPRKVLSATYALEYGEATLELHADAFTATPGLSPREATATVGLSPREATATVGLSPREATATVGLSPREATAAQRVLVVDDVLATGGTAAATLGLIEQAGGTVTGFSVLLELEFLGARAKLAPREVHALLAVD
jgi:adenine phosphoribosyltransferase